MISYEQSELISQYDQKPSSIDVENAKIILQDLFPQADPREILDMIDIKMKTFIAIGTQYKTDIEIGGARYKDVLLIAMAEILLELQPYEVILMYLYPDMNRFFHSLSIWYHAYRTGMACNVHA